MTSLLANPNRQFTAVEQAFFQRWWQEQVKKQLIAFIVCRKKLILLITPY